MAAVSRLLGGLTFGHLDPLFAVGARKQRLDDEDVPRCEESVSAAYAERTLEAAWLQTAPEKRPGVRFAKMMWARYKAVLCGVLGLRMTEDLLSFSGPMIMQEIIGWLGDPAQQAPWWEPSGLPAKARPRASLSSSADIHPNALGSSCNRMQL